MIINLIGIMILKILWNQQIKELDTIFNSDEISRFPQTIRCIIIDNISWLIGILIQMAVLFNLGMYIDTKNDTGKKELIFLSTTPYFVVPSSGS